MDTDTHGSESELTEAVIVVEEKLIGLGGKNPVAVPAPGRSHKLC